MIVVSKIYKRFDSSLVFWSGFSVRRYYGVEHIDDPCLLNLAVNPKEYLELFESKYLNKKHRGMKKGSSGLSFENKKNWIICKFRYLSKNPPQQE